MTFYKLNTPTVSAELLDNEILAINLKTGRYYSFHDTATIFWRLLSDGYSLESAAFKISEIYGVNLSTTKEDFLNFVAELINNELMVKTEKPVVAENSEWLNSIRGNYSKPSIEIHTDMEDLVLLY